MADLTRPYGRQVSDASSWLNQCPELRTRLELVDLMKRRRKVRKAVLKKLFHRPDR